MKTAFVIRDIPDLDHITPIIYKFLVNKEDFVILNYEINLNLQNDFRINFLEKKFGNINIINLYSYLDQNIIYFFLSKIFSLKNFEVNFKNLKNEKKYDFNFFKKFLIAVIKKLFFRKNSIIENIFFNKKWIKKIFYLLNIKSVVIDDSSYLIYNKAQNIVEVCKEEGLKINLVPHTCFICDLEEDYKYIKKNLNKFDYFPNILTNSEYRREKYLKTGIDKKNIFVVGSARFSPEWIKIFKDITNCNLNKTNSKTKVLYFEGTYNNQYLEKELINYLSSIDYIDLVVKMHPRGIFSQKQIIKKNNINFHLDINTPSTKLIYDTDLVIGTFSSILIDAFIFNKTVIYPKFLIDENKVKILYAEKGFTIDCDSNEEVLNAILRFKNNEILINKFNLDKFLQEYVYGNNDKENILNDFVNLLKPEEKIQN